MLIFNLVRHCVTFNVASNKEAVCLSSFVFFGKEYLRLLTHTTYMFAFRPRVTVALINTNDIPLSCTEGESINGI